MRKLGVYHFVRSPNKDAIEAKNNDTLEGEQRSEIRGKRKRL